MKPRIFKSGVYWVVECEGLRYSFFCFETAVESLRAGLRGVDPLPHWLGARLEPSLV